MDFLTGMISAAASVYPNGEPGIHIIGAVCAAAVGLVIVIGLFPCAALGTFRNDGAKAWKAMPFLGVTLVWIAVLFVIHVAIGLTLQIFFKWEIPLTQTPLGDGYTYSVVSWVVGVAIAAIELMAVAGLYIGYLRRIKNEPIFEPYQSGWFPQAFTELLRGDFGPEGERDWQPIVAGYLRLAAPGVLLAVLLAYFFSVDGFVCILAGITCTALCYAFKKAGEDETFRRTVNLAAFAAIVFGLTLWLTPFGITISAIVASLCLFSGMLFGITETIVMLIGCSVVAALLYLPFEWRGWYVGAPVLLLAGILAYTRTEQGEKIRGLLIGGYIVGLVAMILLTIFGYQGAIAIVVWAVTGVWAFFKSLFSPAEA